MAVLGKRKTPESSAIAESAEEIFRRHFEAQFDPLNVPEKNEASNDEDNVEDDEDGDEWDGLSDDEMSDDGSDEDEDEDAQTSQPRRGKRQVSTVEVVDHSSSQTTTPVAMSKRELKIFMSSRPPEQITTPKPTPEQTSKTSNLLPEDAPSLLKQDLELRRLISESHLLQPAISSTVEPRAFTSGRIRQKATDLRIQALGSKESTFKQEKMPMNMRKGIVLAADTREAKRRKEAKENGVILEREVGKGKKKDKRSGDFGGDRPGMGRMRGATLTLNDSAVRSIEGSRDVFGRRSGGGRRG